MFELLGWSLLAGIANALAGGGLFFTLPALLALGIPSTSAVATANVASWPGYISAFWGIRKKLRTGPLWALTVIGLLGGGLGALVLVQFDASNFNYWVPWLLLAVSVLYARQLLSKAGFEGPLVLRLRGWPLLFSGSFYGGFFGGGLGVLFMSITGQLRMGSNLQQHAIKLYLSMLASGATIVVYSLSGLVYWQGGVVLALGYLIGGKLGAKLLTRINPKLLAWSIVTFGMVLSGYYFVRFYL
ncbi:MULTISPECIES: sulfite exporter TauE/SafE family protein [Oceanisphaera]|uniref:Probable membrane transporter protein n=1 Tax=Oceanisphaera ostreae TaxID=914151 RepID=A0ABW3KD69_9GAMM